MVTPLFFDFNGNKVVPEKFETKYWPACSCSYLKDISYRFVPAQENTQKTGHGPTYNWHTRSRIHTCRGRRSRGRYINFLANIAPCGTSGWLVGRSFGRSVGRLVGWLVGWAKTPRPYGVHIPFLGWQSDRASEWVEAFACLWVSLPKEEARSTFNSFGPNSLPSGGGGTNEDIPLHASCRLSRFPAMPTSTGKNLPFPVLGGS